MRRSMGLLLLAGCNSIFGLDDESTFGTDACPDEDCDNIVEGDNCPTVANGDQHDEDADGIGDACDPCVLIANTSGDADDDGIDDACDPTPEPDCLAILDSMDNSSAPPWVALMFGGAAVTPQANAVVIDGSPGGAGLVLTTGGVISLQASYEGFDTTTGQLRMVSLGDQFLDMGPSCVTGMNIMVANQILNPTPASSVTITPPLAASDRFVFTVGRSSTMIYCTLTRGADRFALAGQPLQPKTSNGLRVDNSTVTVTALAIYVPRVGACPAPTLR